jgi:hypothetical protein
MEELADLIYHDRIYAGIDNVSRVKEIKFEANDYTGAEFRLAALTSNERIAALINDLGDGHPRTISERCLAKEFGLPAGEAAAMKLIEMDQNRSEHTTEQFTALIVLIGEVHDKNQKRLLEYFMNDPNEEIARRSRSSYDSL